MAELAAAGGTPVRTDPFPPWPRAGEPERRALLAALDSGNWDSRHGTFVRSFEERFAAYQDAAWGVCVTNGEAALRIAVLGLELPPGAEVVVPAYTFVASATAVVQAGAVPVFVDVDPGTYCIDPGAAEAAVGPATAALMPVHFGGLPCDMDPLLEIAGRHDLAVIEDAAQGWGARHRDRAVGAIGDAGAFSFHASKNLSAGEGGVVLTDDEALASRCRSLSDCGRAGPEERYRHTILGDNSRMSEFQGAVLCGQLDRYPELHRRRERNARRLRAALAEVDGVEPQAWPETATACAWHLVVLRIRRQAFGGLSKGRLVEALAAEGIPATGGYPTPAYGQPVFDVPGIDHRRTECPVSERACEEEAIWLRQNVLLGDEEDALDAVRALEKLQRHHGELEE